MSLSANESCEPLRRLLNQHGSSSNAWFPLLFPNYSVAGCRARLRAYILQPPADVAGGALADLRIPQLPPLNHDYADPIHKLINRPMEITEPLTNSAITRPSEHREPSATRTTVTSDPFAYNPSAKEALNVARPHAVGG